MQFEDCIIVLLDGTVKVEKCAYQVESENYGHELSFTL